MEPWTLNYWQERIGAWVTRNYGAAFLHHPKERSLRLLEETLEFAQAVDLPQDKVLKMVERVYSRPKGSTNQELSQVALCLFAAAQGLLIDLQAELALDMPMLEEKTEKNPNYYRERTRWKGELSYYNAS